ncbi:MAG: cytochrome P450 [Sphingomonadales bacterium]
MSPVNRMAEPICPRTLDEAVLADSEVLECPYPTYALLREQAPVWLDPLTGVYNITRYDDLRQVLRDTETFSNRRPGEEFSNPTGVARLVYERYRERGWVPGVSLAGRDDPEHRQMRAMFDRAFTASRIKEMDSFVEQVAYQLIDGFIGDGRCEFVGQYAAPLPLIVICRQMGARDEDIWRIKEWTDAWIRGRGLGLTEEELLRAIDKEIEAQHYFQPIFERLRRVPDDTLLSALVNTVIPEWGRPLTDSELHAEMMQDTFVGGSETTTNAIAGGLMLLGMNPDVWARLKSDPDRYLKTFCEEVVRLESPVQGLTRLTTRDVELHGVTIPQGSIVCVRFAAANRDPEKFEHPDEVDLERRNAGAHLGFSSGTHHCLGAPLARRELYGAFRAFMDKIEDFRLAPGNAFRHVPNYALRIKTTLCIEFTARRDSGV